MTFPPNKFYEDFKCCKNHRFPADLGMTNWEFGNKIWDRALYYINLKWYSLKFQK